MQSSSNDIGHVLKATDLNKIVAVKSSGRKKIMVVSHERSGTHFLINTIGLNFPEYDNNVLSMVGPVKDIEKIVHTYTRIDENRVFKSHHQVEFVENVMDELLKHFIIFYIVRDGRDVLNSCFHYFNHSPEKYFPHFKKISELLRADPTEFCFDKAYSLVKSDNFVQRWVRHVTGWLRWEERIYVVKYASLKNKFTDTVESIGSVLGIPASKDIIRPRLKQNTVYPRKGTVGDWAN